MTFTVLQKKLSRICERCYFRCSNGRWNNTTTFRCVKCEKMISSLREAIDHVDDSVTPKETDIMGNFDNAIKILEGHPD